MRVKLPRSTGERQIMLGLFILLFVIIGTVFWASLRASQPGSALNTTTGTVLAPAATVADASAAGGQAVQFNPAQSNGQMWKPTASVPLSFHWMLDGPLDLTNPTEMGLRGLLGVNPTTVYPAPVVMDIDGETNTAATVASLHAQGKKVICYIDVGAYETYRSDASKFQALKPQIWGSADAGWPGSFWLDIRRISDLAPIMQARMQDCKNKGFDSIEPDEMTGWSNPSGFPLTYQDQINYNVAVSNWAHAIGLSVGMKGDIEQTKDLVNNFDWVLNEECFFYGECTSVDETGLVSKGAPNLSNAPGLQLFSQQNKAVWVAEYPEDYGKIAIPTSWNVTCQTSSQQHWNTYLFRLGLPTNGGRIPCTTAATW